MKEPPWVVSTPALVIHMSSNRKYKNKCTLSICSSEQLCNSLYCVWIRQVTFGLVALLCRRTPLLSQARLHLDGNLSRLSTKCIWIHQTTVHISSEVFHDWRGMLSSNKLSMKTLQRPFPRIQCAKWDLLPQHWARETSGAPTLCCKSTVQWSSLSRAVF